jgi:hypothetical protein
MLLRNARLITAAVLATVAMAACNSADRQAAQTGQTTQTATPQDTILTHQNEALQHEKDSLMTSMKSVFEAMNSIDSADALAGYKQGKYQGEPLQRDEVLIRNRTLKALARLRVVESRLKASVARATKLSGENGALNIQLVQFRQTADALQLQLNTQQARADTLMQRLVVANSRIDSLGTSNRQLTISVDSFNTVARKGFIVMGTKDYLLKHNLVNEVGGTRFPFIVKIGSTLRPASAHLDTALFLPVDRQATMIPLKPNTDYEIVSAQDLDGTDRTNAKGRIFRGSIHITDPKLFWTPSSFLILREL